MSREIVTGVAIRLRSPSPGSARSAGSSPTPAGRGGRSRNGASFRTGAPDGAGEPVTGGLGPGDAALPAGGDAPAGDGGAPAVAAAAGRADEGGPGHAGTTFFPRSMDSAVPSTACRARASASRCSRARSTKCSDHRNTPRIRQTAAVAKNSP